MEQGAGEMYMGAVDALEGEGKAGMAADIFHQAIGNQVLSWQATAVIAGLCWATWSSAKRGGEQTY